VEFRILGPLEVSDKGRLVDIGSPRQCALLALLLLHANEVVSRDRLIDELWGEKPPATAVKTVQAYVSRLRAALHGRGPPSENGRLETRGHGYLLKVEPGELDVDHFQGLLEDARRALAHGKPERAAEGLREALALWRGPALADLTYEGFARAELARLAELHVSALEDRVEADLALGRHAALVGELEGLVASFPLRERLRGQLMLALYRSGRQAEALQIFQQYRRELAEELGLKPSEGLRRLERKILEQDPGLAPPERATRPRLAPTRARLPPRLLAIGALVLATAIVAAVFQLVREGGAEPVVGDAREGPGAGALDPRTGALLASIPLGTAPSTIAVGEGSVWVLDANDRTISRIDPTERARVRTFSTASTPTDLAVGADAIWIGNAFREGGFASTNFPQSISRLDPQSGVVDKTIPLPRADAGVYFQGGGFSQQHIAATRAAVWAINPDQTVSRIDPRTNRAVATVEEVRASDIDAGDGGVWVVGEQGVVQIDPGTNAVSQRIEVAAESLTGLAVGAGAVWVADPLGGSVWRIDPGPDPLLRQIPLELGVRSVAFGHGVLWATNEIADKIYRIDPRTNKARVVSRRVAPQRVAVGRGAVWVTALGPPSGQETLPASACGDVFAGGAGRPRFLIVSDLPLQGPTRSSTLPMVEAIRFVLQRHGFRAGRYSVGHQSCDDSTAQAGGFDFFRCFSNGKAYARDLDVIGVIGAYHSFCSMVQIPIANQAARGPLAMISPSNSLAWLTRPHRAMPPDALQDLYPTGARNYVRIVGADHLAPLALVEAAKRLGKKRVFVLWDGDDPYMTGFAADMREAGRKLGLELAGIGAWNPQARDFARLARRIAAARADAVLMAGAAPPHTGALLRDLRAELGRGVALIATDGFASFDEVIAAAGPAARGMYVGNAGVPNGKLPPAGRRFLRRFERTRQGNPGPNFSAAYGAQAAEILLDAIARSDGTRSSVTRELRRTRIEDRILGDIRFDENGDLVEAPVTIFRVAAHGPVVSRMITVRSGSLR
jgi:DNA-binding SARP family transcriptional activator/ABC-type branched-subunit amino acid transport system substrate-binding protein